MIEEEEAPSLHKRELKILWGKKFGTTRCYNPKHRSEVTMPRPRKSSYRNTRPPFSYISLCAMAIESSPTKMMTLQEMYQYVSDKFEFYRYGDKKWKNSLRHNLSFNDCFIKVEANKAIDQKRGRKGSYWTMHPKSRGMFLNGSTLRRKIRFREAETQRRKGDTKISDFKSPRKAMSTNEETPRKTTHSHRVFSDSTTVDQKCVGLSAYDSKTCNPYGRKEVSRRAFDTGDSVKYKKPITSSTFTIENILKSSKKESRDDTLKQTKTRRQEPQSSTYVPTQYSLGSWKPMVNQMHAVNRRAVSDEGSLYTKRYKTCEISAKQPLCRCPYCTRIPQDIRCFCEICYVRYSTS